MKRLWAFFMRRTSNIMHVSVLTFWQLTWTWYSHDLNESHLVSHLSPKEIPAGAYRAVYSRHFFMIDLQQTAAFSSLQLALYNGATFSLHSHWHTAEFLLISLCDCHVAQISFPKIAIAKWSQPYCHNVQRLAIGLVRLFRVRANRIPIYEKRDN